jgi:hypothetical protein
MVEVEQPEGISARKLILETARHNVITAYTGKGALELLRRFPNVDVAVVHTEQEDTSFEKTISQPRKSALICQSLVYPQPWTEGGSSGSFDLQLRPAVAFAVARRTLRGGDVRRTLAFGQRSLQY